MEAQYGIVEPENLKVLHSLQDITEAQLLAGQMIELPSPPSIVVRILNAVQDDDNCFADLGKIISNDPALAAKLLKVANSSMYGFDGRIKNIESALAILGINSLKNIALSFVIVRQMKGDSDSYFDFQYYWKRSVTAAVAAKILAPLVDVDCDDAFVGGLLQDIGMLVFFHHCYDSYMKVVALKNSTAAPGHVIERKLLGLCHAELGGALLKDWGLPESIYLPIFYHHWHDCVPERYRVAVDILTLADRISAIYHGSQSNTTVSEVVKVLTGRYGLNEEETEELIDMVAVHANEVMEFFEVTGDGIRPLSQMLQEANQELAKLNYSYEQQVRELKQTGEETSQYVSKLIETNNKYLETTYRDELTGLFNFRYFQKILEKELARAKRYQHALSLLFFDIDHFKEINNRYDHFAGDTVLKRIAERILQIMRPSDIIVRYHRDEFAMIMPETDRKGAEIFAERIRRDIETVRIPIGEALIQVTVSIGGATFCDNDHDVGKRTLLSAADKAIYQAKREGRNRIAIADI